MHDSTDELNACPILWMFCTFSVFSLVGREAIFLLFRLRTLFYLRTLEPVPGPIDVNGNFGIDFSGTRNGSKVSCLTIFSCTVLVQWMLSSTLYPKCRGKGWDWVYKT